MNFKRYKDCGMSLIELMISIAIGALLMIGLVSTFKTSSDTKRELERAGQLIENGRYAISVLSDDIRHAGYYGALFDIGDPLSAMPDPCVTTNLAALQAAMAMPVEGYNADTTTTPFPFAVPNLGATTCGAGGLNLLIPEVKVGVTSFGDDKFSGSLKKGSDVLVIRRASTSLYYDCTAATPQTTVKAIDNDDVFLVANSSAGVLQQANTGDDLSSTTWTSMKKYPFIGDPTIPAGKPCATKPNIADTRKYDVHIYFVAPCSIGNGANGVCDGTESTANSIPTLKRLELKAVDTDGDNTGDTLTMEIVPLVEGVEYFKVEYGIDNSPTKINPLTKYSGDGVPDIYVLKPTAVEDWQAVVALKIYIVARSTSPTQGYSDKKSFVLGTVDPTDIPAANDRYRRNVFTAEIRPTNMAGRREIP